MKKGTNTRISLKRKNKNLKIKTVGYYAINYADEP